MTGAFFKAWQGLLWLLGDREEEEEEEEAAPGDAGVKQQKKSGGERIKTVAK